MKKNSLVQLIIIYVGILALYTAASFISSAIVTIAISIIDNGNRSRYWEEGYLFSYLAVGLLGYIIVSKSGALSQFISDRAGFDDSLTVFTKPNQLLSILIVVLALGHIIDHIPSFLINTYQVFFKNEPVTGLYGSGSPTYNAQGFLFDLLHLLLPCLLIIFCRTLTAYFSKNIVLDDEDIVAVHETIQIEGDNKQG